MPDTTVGPGGILGVAMSSAVPPKATYDPTTDLNGAIYRMAMGLPPTMDAGNYDLAAMLKSGNSSPAHMGGMSLADTLMAAAPPAAVPPPQPAPAPQPMVPLASQSQADLMPSVTAAQATAGPMVPAPTSAPVSPTGLPNIPLPTFLPHPDAPAPLAVAPPPAIDLAKIAAGGKDALSGVGNLLGYANLASLLMGGAGAAQGVNMSAGKMLEAALSGNDAGAQERFEREKENYALGQQAQQTEDARRQLQYGQQVAGVDAANRNPQQLFEDAAQLRQQDMMGQWHQGVVGNGAVRNTNATRVQIVGMDPVTQEQFLSANPQAQAALGLPIQRAPDGTYIPYTSNRDDNAATAAAAKTTTAGASVARANASQQNADTHSWEAKQLAKHWGITADIAQQSITERMRHDGVTEQEAATRIGQDQERIALHDKEIKISYERLNNATATADPAKQQLKLTQAIADASGKQQAIQMRLSTMKPRLRAAMSDDALQSDTRAMAAYDTVINAATQQMQRLKGLQPVAAPAPAAAPAAQVRTAAPPAPAAPAPSTGRILSRSQIDALTPAQKAAHLAQILGGK